MGLILTVAVAAFGLGLLTGGAPAALARRRLRAWPLLAGSVTAELVGAAALGPGGRTYLAALAVAGALAVGFVARNVGIPGVLLVGAGLVSNAVVVGLNGAMPVSLAAAAHAGVPLDRLALAADPRHEALGPATRLGWLGDVVPVPSPIRREVLSVGDVAVAVGIGWYVWAGLRRCGSDSPGDSDAPLNSAVWP